MLMLFVTLFAAIIIAILQGFIFLSGLKSQNVFDEKYREEQDQDVNILYLSHQDEGSTRSVTLDTKYIEIPDSDVELIAKLLWFEARGECDDCKRRVVSVVINRMTTSNLSAHDVIYAENQFEPACNIENSNISLEEMEHMKNIVNEIIETGPTVPEYVTYFRAGHFHNFDGQVPYISCCNTYVSYDYNMYLEYINE